MLRKSHWNCALLLALWLIAATVPALAGSDPIVRMDVTSKIELDLGMMIDDLKPIFLEMMAEEDPEAAQTMEFMLEVIGLEALQTLKIESDESRDRSEAEIQLILDPEYRNSLLFRLYTTPNGECRFARRLDRDDLVMFMTLHNFPHVMNVFLDFLKSPEMAPLVENLPVNADGDLDFEGFVPRTDLLPLLSGELDFFILETAEDQPLSPLNMPFCIVLGSQDGFALRNLLLGLVDAMNPEAGIGDMLAAGEVEQVGDFEWQVTPFGLGIATSEDYLVLGMATDSMRPLLAGEKGDMRVPDGIEYVYLDGQGYGSFMGSVMEMAAGMGGGDDETLAMMEIYSILFEHLDSEEALYRSRGDDTLEMKVEVRGTLMTGLYQLIPRFMEMAAAEREKDQMMEGIFEYQDAVGQMDGAMMAFADDHDGLYPEDPKDLYLEGYLEDWPFLNATPAGEYADWCYTYHKYTDEQGAVVGYMFFLYGVDPDEGFDVYTPQNLTAEGPFRPDRDGKPDGVVTYCYDGVALEIVEEFLDR